MPDPAPLGNNTKSAAAPDRAALARLERFELQSVSRQLLKGERVAACLMHRVSNCTGVEVLHNRERGSAHYGNLRVCGSVWHCPLCAAKVSERRRVELELAIAAWRAKGGVVLLASYTVSHGRSDDLSATLGGFLAAQRSMVQNRAYRSLRDAEGLKHTIKALEVTWGEAHGWHPHCHTLIFASADVDLAGVEEELYRCWSAAAGRHGLTLDRAHGVKLQATTAAVDEYITKWGRAWSAADELVKAHTKHGRSVAGAKRFTPFDLLRWLADTGESQAAALFRQYAGVFKGRRQLVWSPGLRAELKLGEEQTDEEIATAAVDDAVLLVTLTTDQWAAVKWCGKRGEVLEVARSGDAHQVGRFVGLLVEQYQQREPRLIVANPLLGAVQPSPQVLVPFQRGECGEVFQDEVALAIESCQRGGEACFPGLHCSSSPGGASRSPWPSWSSSSPRCRPAHRR